MHIPFEEIIRRLFYYCRICSATIILERTRLRLDSYLMLDNRHVQQ